MSNPQNAGQGGTNYINRKVAFAAAQVYCATINVADPAALTDLNVSLLSMDAAGRLRSLMTPAAGSVFSVSPAILVDSLAVRTTTAAPGAGAALATIVAPPAGTYDIQATVSFRVAGTADNAEFREGAAVVSQLQLPAVVSQIPLVHLFRLVLNGATNISINATAADGVGTYSAMLIATRIA